MKLGIVGLGRMGNGMRERLRRADHEVVGFDLNPDIRDVDSLQALVDALTPPRVARAARDGLRFMSRKERGFGMPSSPKSNNRFNITEYEPAQSKWTDWFLSVRPDGELIE